MKIEYKKLPGKGKHWFCAYTLWSARDHLLSVETSLAAESYRRFYFKDIQTLVMRKTVRGKVINFFFASLLFLFGLLLLTLGDEGMPQMLIFVGFPALLLIVNIWRGPTCEVVLKTAVQAEPLRSLNRVKHYRRVRERILERVAQVQRPLSRTDILNGFSTSAVMPAIGREAITPLTSQSKKEESRETGTVHLTLFAVMLLNAVVMAAWYEWPGRWGMVVSILVSVVGSVMAIVALVRQHKKDIGTPLRVLTWVATLYFGISLTRDYLLMEFNSAMNLSVYDDGKIGVIRDIRHFMMENSYMIATRSGFALFAMFTGLIGLWLAYRYWRIMQIPTEPRRNSTGYHRG